VKITLPNPCPICLGTVVYGGTGRRPDYCSNDCKNVQRAEDARNRRARATQTVAPVDPLIRALAERRAQRAEAVPRVEVVRAPGDEVPHVRQAAAEAFGEGAARFNLGEAGYVVDGYAERTARSRDKDPAAAWLAEFHPGELATFPADF
jgi:endogenous inhibitor of DNA gyrase (YacG/DUF329 family)